MSGLTELVRFLEGIDLRKDPRRKLRPHIIKGTHVMISNKSSWKKSRFTPEVVSQISVEYHLVDKKGKIELAKRYKTTTSYLRRLANVGLAKKYPSEERKYD